MFVPPGGDEPENEPEEHLRPDWLGPAEDELGRAVDLSLVLGRGDRGVVAVPYAIAYSNGLELHVVARARGVTRSEAARFHHEQHMGVADPSDPMPGFLRLGLELPDGTRVSNLRNVLRSRAFESEPTGPVFFMHGGSGGQTTRDSVETKPAYWLWPLPAPGVIRVSCEWPVAGIPFTTVELDTAPLLDAAARAIQL